MSQEELLELEQEKNVVLKDINETLNKIHSTLQNMNSKMSNENAKDIDKIKDQLTWMKDTLIPERREKSILKKLTQSFSSVQIVENTSENTNDNF